MSTTRIAFLLALAAGIAPAQDDGTRPEPATIVVQCKPDALIRGTSILLRDLAEVSASDAALAARAGEIRLSHRPSFGFNRVFTQGDIGRALVQAGLRASQFELAGAREVIAQPLTTQLKPEDVREAADPVLRAALELEPDADVEFEPVGLLTAIRVPPGRLDLHLHARLRPGQLGTSSASVDVDVVVDGEVFKTVPVNYRLRRFVPAVLAAQAIKKGEPFGVDNLTQKRMEISAGADFYVTSLEQVQGMVAARTVTNGKVLHIGDLTLPAAVFRNDPVRLISRRGQVLVTAKALALQDGAVGSRIPVRNFSSGLVVQAVVHSPGVVLLPTSR